MNEAPAKGNKMIFKLTVIVETQDKTLRRELFGAKDIEIGKEVTIPGNAKICYGGNVLQKGILPEVGESLEFILTFSSGVASSIVASWLYNKFNNRVKEIRFEHTTIEISKDRIQNIIQETLELKET